MVNKYEVFSEKRGAPFGLIRVRKSLGQLAAGQSVEFARGPNHVELDLEQSGALNIRSKGYPVTVVFEAQSQMRKPKVVATLDQNNPTIRTGRSRLSISDYGEVSSKLLLVGPEPVPLRLKREEVPLFIALAVADDKIRQLRNKIDELRRVQGVDSVQEQQY